MPEAPGIDVEAMRAKQALHLAATIDANVLAGGHSLDRRRLPDQPLRERVRDADGDGATGPEDASELGEEKRVIGHVLEDFGADDAVEGRRRQRGGAGRRPGRRRRWRAVCPRAQAEAEELGRLQVPKGAVEADDGATVDGRRENVTAGAAADIEKTVAVAQAEEIEVDRCPFATGAVAVGRLIAIGGLTRQGRHPSRELLRLSLDWLSA